MALLGLRFCVRAFSSCGKRGPLFIAVRGPLFIAVRGPLFITVRGPLTIAAPLVAEHRLQMRRLSNCGSRAELLRGMWDLPRPGLEPVSPALAGRLSTTAPPGKPQYFIFLMAKYYFIIWICCFLKKPFLHWWMGLFPPFSYLEKCCPKHCVQVSVWHLFSLLLSIYPSGVAGSHGNSVFDHLRNCQTVFQSSCPIFHSHYQCIKVPVFSHTCKYLLSFFFFFFFLAVLGLRCCAGFL